MSQAAFFKIIVSMCWILSATLIVTVIAVLCAGCYRTPTVEQGARWLGYAGNLEQCDSVRDAGADARSAVFEECVAARGLERGKR